MIVIFENNLEHLCYDCLLAEYKRLHNTIPFSDAFLIDNYKMSNKTCLDWVKIYLDNICDS